MADIKVNGELIQKMVEVDSSGVSTVIRPAGTNRSGAITVGGTAQSVAAANTVRRGMLIQNISAADLWISETGTAAVDTAGSFKLAANERYEVQSNRAISIVGATTAQKFTAIET